MVEKVSARALERPPEWMSRDRGVWYKPAMVVFPFVLLAAVGFALRDLLPGLIVGAVAFGLFVVAQVLPRPRPLRVSLGEVRLTESIVRGPRFPIRRPRAALAAWTIFAVIFAVVAVGLAIMAFTEDKLASLIGTVVLGAFSAVFTLAVIAYLRRDKTNPPSLTLTERGVVVVGNAARSIAWDDVVGVRAAVLDMLSGWWSVRQNAIVVEVRESAGPTRPARERLRMFASYVVGNGDVEVRNVQLDSDPVVAYHALRFYWEHQDLRQELRGEAAVERIRSGQLGG